MAELRWRLDNDEVKRLIWTRPVRREKVRKKKKREKERRTEPRCRGKQGARDSWLCERKDGRTEAERLGFCVEPVFLRAERAWFVPGR